MLLGLGYIGIYILLVGVATFVEPRISRGLDALRLDALLRAGTFALAVVALLAQPLLPVSGLSAVDTLPGSLLHFPDLQADLAGLGIGLLAGVASISYCLALDRLPGYIVASTANGYIAITVLLGVVVLREPLTFLTAVALVLTVAGVVLLSYQQPSHNPRTGSSLAAMWQAISERLPALGWIGAYIVLVGVSAFLEKPALAHLSPLQLNALVALGMLAAGVAGAALNGRHATASPQHRQQARLGVVVLGAVIGLGVIFYYLGLTRLPVSVAATLSNTYVVVPFALAVLLGHASVSRPKVAGLLVTLAGVSLLALGAR